MGSIKEVVREAADGRQSNGASPCEKRCGSLLAHLLLTHTTPPSPLARNPGDDVVWRPSNRSPRESEGMGVALMVGSTAMRGRLGCFKPRARR